jgi:DNA-binding transcriptional LysR family regulator
MRWRPPPSVVLSDSSPGGLVTKPLRSEPLCFVVAPHHPLAAKRVVSLKQLNATPFAIGIKGNEFSDMVDLILERKGVAIPTRGVTISNLQARKEAARAGVGVAVLPGFAVRNEVRDGTLKSSSLKTFSSTTPISCSLSQQGNMQNRESSW